MNQPFVDIPSFFSRVSVQAHLNWLFISSLYFTLFILKPLQSVMDNSKFKAGLVHFHKSGGEIDLMVKQVVIRLLSWEARKELKVRVGLESHNEVFPGFRTLALIKGFSWICKLKFESDFIGSLSLMFC